MIQERKAGILHGVLFMALFACAAIVKDKKKPSEINDFRGLLARVVRLEHPTLMQYPYSPASKGTYYLLLSTRQKLPADRHFVLFSDDEFRTLSF